MYITTFLAYCGKLLRVAGPVDPRGGCRIPGSRRVGLLIRRYMIMREAHVGVTRSEQAVGYDLDRLFMDDHL